MGAGGGPGGPFPGGVTERGGFPTRGVCSADAVPALGATAPQPLCPFPAECDQGVRWRRTLQLISVSLRDLRVSCLVPWTPLQRATLASPEVSPGLPGPRRGPKAQS